MRPSIDDPTSSSITKVMEEPAKKKNRFSDAPVEAAADPVSGSASSTSDLPVAPVLTAPKARKSRFSSEPAAPAVAPVLSMPLPAAPKVEVMTQETLQHIMIMKIQLQQITERLTTVVQDALAIEENPERSPSPPPKYDGNGKRTNTREVRMRETLNADRTRIIEEMLKLNPSFQAPADFVKAKPTKRIWIQKHENPMINFIGLIIGPRGNTQRQMELESGAKISIRGKGAAKQGTLNRAKQPDDEEELHVHITADEVNTQ